MHIYIYTYIFFCLNLYFVIFITLTAISKFPESTKLISIFRKRTTLFNFKQFFEQDMFRE